MKKSVQKMEIKEEEETAWWEMPKWCKNRNAMQKIQIKRRK